MHNLAALASAALAGVGLAACAAAPIAPPIAPSDAGASPITVPFDVATGRPMVQLKVNGEGPFPFVLDTGNPGVMVSTALVDALDLPVIGQARINSPAGGEPVPADLVAIGSVDLGGAEATGLQAAVVDIGGGGDLGMGVVGPSLWRDQGVVTLDFAANTVAIGGPLDPAIATWIPFGPSAPLLDVPVRIGDVEMPGHIDTGAPHALSVPPAYAERLPLNEPPRVIGRARTIDREFDILGAPLNAEARIGDAVFPIVFITISDLPVANLGTRGLAGLRLTIDWANARFALTGHVDPDETRVMLRSPGAAGAPSAAPAAHARAPFGVQLAAAPGAAPTVAGVIPGSRAEALGLASGDRIVAVNGQATEDMAAPEIGAALGQAPVTLTVERDGAMLELAE